ncbi:PREDICTED: translation initiation factor IF-2-like [Lepidothrix coronata]|uniref:Translation initiation factor IF-2-like n=1 Tax=Lepidothrix coronata TaxID=321398 RepID=A0A6J0IEJ0_9PASS|nr:PREDICTED: translation initiation factor IF-2-like [Lepidothrix coronata]
MRITHFSAGCGRTRELRCRGGSEPSAQFAPRCPGKLRENLWEAQPAAGDRTPPYAAAAHPSSSPLSLPGPGAKEAIEVSRPVPGVRPWSSPQGDARRPAALLLPGAPSSPKRNGPRPER